jgi:hypothetical protein
MTALDPTIPVHPVQNHRYLGRGQCVVRTEVTLRAYEVYEAVHGAQAALITGNCRGGFGVGELIAFLYARSFPRAEWRQRADEAFRNMRLDDR